MNQTEKRTLNNELKKSEDFLFLSESLSKSFLDKKDEETTKKLLEKYFLMEIKKIEDKYVVTQDDLNELEEPLRKYVVTEEEFIKTIVNTKDIPTEYAVSGNFKNVPTDWD